MKKLFKDFTAGIVLGIIAVAFVFSARVASANLTLGALNIISSGALTLEGAAASVITIGALNTGGINIGAGNTVKTINIGTGEAINTINIGYGTYVGDPPVNIINLGNDATRVEINSFIVDNNEGYGLRFDGTTLGDNAYTSFYFEDPTVQNEITFPNATGTVSLLNAAETLTNKTLTSPVMTNPTLGVASATSLTIGSGTINNLSVGGLADGISGWVPDGIATSFTITASPSNIGANTLISVSVGANANLTTCSVSTRTAGTSFVVNCSAAPANGATLQYMMVNDFFGDV